MSQTCRTCRYWNEFKDGKTGACRRYPPQPAGDRGIVVAPQTLPEWWCGEWEERK